MDYTNTPLEHARIYTFAGIDMLHITDFTTLTHRSNQSTRHLIENGNVIRKMKFFRDRSRLMIPVAEIFGYPLVKPGHSDYERAIYHYGIITKEDGTQDIDKVLCKECSYGHICEARKVAESLDMPQGDK
jgi:hypothetical protein